MRVASGTPVFRLFELAADQAFDCVHGVRGKQAQPIPTNGMCKMSATQRFTMRVTQTMECKA
jgi:hypothetical protein